MASITPIEYKVELAFGADKTANPADWEWVDLTNRTTTDSKVKLYDQAVTIEVGSEDESRQVQPATASFTLHNFDGAVTPDNPTSPWYPNVRRGTPCRLSVNAGSPHLSLLGETGSYASTPDAAALDITTDIFIAVDATPYTGRVPVVATHVISKWGAAGQRSWRVYINADGTLRLGWSVDGTATADDQGNTIPLPISLNGRTIWAVGLDVDDDAGGHVVTWYTADSLAGPWTVHQSETLSGTTSIFSSSANLEIGSQNSGAAATNAATFLGEFHAAQVRSGGTSGTIVANPDFTAQTAGATSFADSAGRTWTVNGTATIDSWQRRFLGEVAELSPIWPAGNLPNNAEVKVTAAGVLRRLTQGNEKLSSALFRTITAPRYEDNVFGYWPFEDGSASTVIATPIPGADAMSIVGDYTFAGNSDLASSEALLTVASGETAYMEALVPAIPQVVGVNWMVTRIFRIDDPSTGTPTQLMAVDTNGRVATWRVTIDDTQVAISGVDENDSGVVLDTITTDSRFYDTFAFVMLRVTDDGVNVDWELHVIPFPAGLDFSTTGTFVGNTGIPLMFRNNLVGPPSGITVGHLAFTTDLAVNWTSPADTAYAGEPATQRIARLCEEEGVPVTIDGPLPEAGVSRVAAWEAVAAQGVQAMGPQRADQTLVDLLKECAEVDLGVLSEMRHAPGFAYRARVTIQNQDAGLTWDSSTRGVINPLAPTLDDQKIRNDVTANRIDGSSWRTVDDASVVLDGTYEESVDLNVYRDGQLLDQAGWRLHLGTWPGMRYPSMPLELEFADDLIDDWLNLALGDRAQVTNLPAEHPVGDVDLLVEGYTETFSQWEWTSELNCSPGGPWTVGIVEDDVLGRADTAGSELAVAVSDSATSWSVATTEWPPWRSAAGGAEFPFDLAIAGEEVTVTDIDDIVATFGAVGTVAHGVNASVSPGIPASTAQGNLLLLFAAIRNLGAGTVDDVSGWTRLPIFATDENVALFAKIAGSSESSPTVTFSGGVANADTTAQITRFAGTFYAAANLPVAWGRVGSLSAQDIAYPATRVLYDNSLVLYVGWKADDWTSVASPGTEIAEPDTTTGDDQGIVWAYTIQTTAANISAGSFVVTGGAANVVIGGVIVLRPDVQTFTVTRSTNDVEKSHSAGEAISLANPMIAAM